MSTKEGEVHGFDGATYEGKPDGYTDVSIRCRYFYKMNPTVTLVPHADLSFGKHAELTSLLMLDSIYNQYTGTYDQDRYADAWGLSSKSTSFGAGCGVQYTPVTNVLAVLDFGFSRTSVKEDTAYASAQSRNNSLIVSSVRSYEAKYEETTTILPYWKLGLEGNVFSWLDVRFGATSNWTKATQESIFTKSNRKYKSNYASNTTYLGLGFSFNRLHIDTYMDPEILMDGFNFISGSTDADDMNFQVSVLYEMF